MTGMNLNSNHNMQNIQVSSCACQGMNQLHLAVVFCALFSLIIVNIIGRLIIF